MKKTVILAVITTLCSALLIFTTCCGVTDGLLKGNPFSSTNMDNEDLASLKQNYRLMEETVDASDDTISFWNGAGAILSICSLSLNIALLWTLKTKSKHDHLGR